MTRDTHTAGGLKTHYTAVVVVPPEDLWPPIQAIRRLYDRQIARWMPHVTILYPFRPAPSFSTVIPLLCQACLETRSFTTRLERFSWFVHPSGTCTLWLAPEPSAPWKHLQAVLQACFPDCKDQSAFPAGFTPHLSVGQARDKKNAARLAGVLQDSWRPLEFVVKDVAVISREKDTPFRVNHIITLGGEKS